MKTLLKSVAVWALMILCGVSVRADYNPLPTGQIGVSSGVGNTVGFTTLTYNPTTHLFTINGVTIDSSGNIVSPGALSVSNLIPTTITWGSTVVPLLNGGNGTATPGLVQGTGVTISGSWPNQTITAPGYATHLGTFASPDTTAGSITWTSPVLNIFTSASAALRTYTLPAASSYSGQAFILNVAVGTNHVNVQPASGAQLVLAGVLLTANHYVQAATSAAGNYICFVSDGTNWNSLGSAGTWADASSP